jgi:hypothetical protein
VGRSSGSDNRKLWQRFLKAEGGAGGTPSASKRNPMKSAKSSKRRAANNDPTPMDVEILTATAQALLKKMREDNASPMRTAVSLLRAEAKAAAEKLGVDTSRKDWMKLVK